MATPAEGQSAQGTHSSWGRTSPPAGMGRGALAAIVLVVIAIIGLAGFLATRTTPVAESTSPAASAHVTTAAPAMSQAPPSAAVPTEHASPPSDAPEVTPATTVEPPPRLEPIGAPPVRAPSKRKPPKSGSVQTSGEKPVAAPAAVSTAPPEPSKPKAGAFDDRM